MKKRWFLLLLLGGCAASSAPPPAAVDIAVCIVGQERSFTSPVVYNSIRWNVLEALREDGGDDAWSVDTFVFVKVEKGGNVTLVRRTARKLGAVKAEVVRRAEDYDSRRAASPLFAAPPQCSFRSGPRTPHGPVDYMRRKFALVSDDQAACFKLITAHEREGRAGRRYSHVLKLRADMQMCSRLGVAQLAEVLLRTRDDEVAADPRGAAVAAAAALAAMSPAQRRRLVTGEGAAAIKQRDHWAWLRRDPDASRYFNASGEVLAQCVNRADYNHFGGHSCHWPARTHGHDVPNECLLDRWLWAGRVDFVETLQPTCIRKLRLRRPEPCPQISFNRNWRLNTSLCYSSGGKEPHAQPHAQPPSIAGETVHEAAMQQRQLIRHRRQRVAATQSTISEYRKKKNEAEEHDQFAWAVA